MGKFSSSSRQGKPHYVISIRASLALLAGGVFSLTFLHANETDGEISFEISPQLESPSIPFVVVEKDELNANFESGQSEMSFEMAPSIPKLHQSQSSHKKSSHFQDKKGINFSEEIQANQSYFSSASNLDDSASSANGAIHPSKEASKLTPKHGSLSNEFASKAYPSVEMGLSFDEGSFDELLEISVDEKKMQFNEVPSFNSRDFHPTVWVESIGLAEEKSSFEPGSCTRKSFKRKSFQEQKDRP